MDLSNEECSVISIEVERKVKAWQKKIHDNINLWGKNTTDIQKGV
jgi:5-methylcytosine-specific restriction enzyme subunit McrC